MDKRMYKHHIITDGSIAIVCDDGLISVDKDHKDFNKVSSLLRQRNFDKAVLLADKANALSVISKDEFYVKNDKVHYNKEPLPVGLSNRIINFIVNDLPYSTFKNFWRNLRSNPSESSRNQLYDFLERHAVPITEDGCFIVYKGVKTDYMDKYKGEFDNTPGNVITIRRDLVDKNNVNHCSFGLHVAAFDYAKSYAGTDGRLVEVKVNPKDVVSVPTDSNFEKLRVCKYEVLHDVTQDVECKDVAYNQRTYYYNGSMRNFDMKMVKSHKPNRVTLTCRAVNLLEAVRKFKGMANLLGR
jgi:hypothetical protein